MGLQLAPCVTSPFVDIFSHHIFDIHSWIFRLVIKSFLLALNGLAFIAIGSSGRFWRGLFLFIPFIPLILSFLFSHILFFSPFLIFYLLLTLVSSFPIALALLVWFPCFFAMIGSECGVVALYLLLFVSGD